MKIYRSFDEFLDTNKTIFEFLGSTERVGIFRAIWNAREGEIVELSEKIKEQEYRLENIKTEEGKWKNYVKQVEAELSSNTCSIELALEERTRGEEGLKRALAELAILSAEKQEYLQHKLSLQAELDETLASKMAMKQHLETERMAREQSDEVANSALHAKNQIEQDLALTKEELQTLRKEKLVLKSELKNIIDELQGHYFERQRVASENGSLKKLIEELKTQNFQVDAEKNQLQAELSHYQNDLAGLIEEVENQKIELSLLKEDKQKMSSAQIELTKNVGNLSTELNKKEIELRELTIHANEHSSIREDAKKSVELANREKQEALIQLDLYKNDLASLFEENQLLKQRSKELQSSLEDLQTLLKHYQEASHHLTGENEKLKLETFDIHSRQSGRQSELEQKEIQIFRLTEESASLKEELKRSESALNHQRQNFFELKSGVDELVDHLHRVKEEKLSVSRKLSLYEERFESLAKETSYYKHLKDQAESDLNSLKSMIEQFQTGFKRQPVKSLPELPFN